jgi:hypothetical protein
MKMTYDKVLLVRDRVLGTPFGDAVFLFSACAMIAACSGNGAPSGALGSGSGASEGGSSSGAPENGSGTSEGGASGLTDASSSGQASDAQLEQNLAGCPGSLDQLPSTCPDETFLCVYPSTICACNTYLSYRYYGLYYGQWLCYGSGSSAGCPIVEPDVGSSCTGNTGWCDYGTCVLGGKTVACVSGIWQQQVMSCPELSLQTNDAGSDADAGSADAGQDAGAGTDAD